MYVESTQDLFYLCHHSASTKIPSIHKQNLLDSWLIVAEKFVFKQVKMAAEVGVLSAVSFKLPTTNKLFSPFPPHALAIHIHTKRSHGFRVSANLGCHNSRNSTLFVTPRCTNTVADFVRWWRRRRYQKGKEEVHHQGTRTRTVIFIILYLTMCLYLQMLIDHFNQLGAYYILKDYAYAYVYVYVIDDSRLFMVMFCVGIGKQPVKEKGRIPWKLHSLI